MTYIDLINNGLLDSLFPYPLAFETAYNLCMQLFDILTKMVNLGWGAIILCLCVLFSRLCFKLMR